jgi:hypothetical protein
MTKAHKIAILITLFTAIIVLPGISYYLARCRYTPVPAEDWSPWQSPIMVTNTVVNGRVIFVQLRQSTNTGAAQMRYVPEVK